MENKQEDSLDWSQEDDVLERSNTEVMRTSPYPQPAYHRDKWLYRGVAFSLAGGVIICLGGAIYLAIHNTPVPEIMTALGSAAVGALAGLFANKN